MTESRPALDSKPDSGDMIPVAVIIPPEDYREVVGLSVLDGKSAADVVRAAVAAYITRRRDDPELPAKIEAAIYRRN